MAGGTGGGSRRRARAELHDGPPEEATATGGVAAIGVDCCDVARMRHALEAAGGDRFRARVFTDAEQAYCEARRRARFESYAARFAAKEAVMKALGTGWSRGVGFRDVEVVRAGEGAPAVRLHGVAATLARRRGLGRWLVSLSHTETTAVAFVVAGAGRVRAGGPSRAASRPGGAAAAAPPPPRSRRRSR